MEKLQGPINPCLFEEENAGVGLVVLSSTEEGELRFEQQQQQAVQVARSSSSLLDETMPFLEMLQSVECGSLLQDPTFQLLRPLSHYELENETVPKAEHPLAMAMAMAMTTTMPMTTTNPSSSTRARTRTRTREEMAPPANASAKEKRKRKRSTVTKNTQQVETQRMTHIAVERNRRRQMNDHLNALRSLMPSTYIQRGDQASIIGGAIDFVKELEQLLQSLQAHKRVTQEDSNDVSTTTSSSSSSSSSSNNNNNAAGGCELADVDVDVVVIQNHVNLKIHCQRKPGQLIRALLALEDLSLSVLHLNITSSHHTCSAHYSLNLKIEDDCNLRSATQIAGAVHQIFNLIYSLEI